MKHIAIWALVMTVVCPVLAGDRYALIVGVDDYPGTARLECARVDVPNVVGLLRDTYKFPEHNIKILRDQAATSTAIRQSFKTHLIDQVKPGDVAVFYFTGHGSTRPDLNGEEEDGLDELICPVDYSPLKWDEMITDDDLGAWLRQIKTQNIVVVLDCCHSGTGTRGPSTDGDREKYFPGGFVPLEERRKAQRSRSSAITRGPIRGVMVEAKPFRPVSGLPEKTRPSKPQTTAEMNHILLAACAADQKALGGIRGSSFTSALVKYLRDKPGITYAELGRLVVPVVEDYARKQGKGIQTPQVEGRVDQRAFANPDATAPAAFAGHPGTATTIDGFGPIPYRDFPLSVAVDQPLYRVDEIVSVKLMAAVDCYVRLYHIAADGVTTQIFPNKFQQDNHLLGGQVVLVPPKDASFQFRVTAPLGVEIIRAIAATEQFEDLRNVRGKDFVSGPFMDLGAVTPGDTGRRGMKVEERPKPATTSTTVAPFQTQNAIRRSSAYVVYEVAK